MLLKTTNQSSNRSICHTLTTYQFIDVQL
jgi:uncharacterized membrane protein